MAGVSQQSVQNKKKAPVTPHMAHQTPLARNIHATPSVTFNNDPVSTQRGLVTSGNNIPVGRPQLYYRKVLPKETKWTGSSTSNFEEFLGDLNAHISQQIHLTYIIQPPFIALWLKYGVVSQVLELARRMKLSYSLDYISEEQFIMT